MGGSGNEETFTRLGGRYGEMDQNNMTGQRRECTVIFRGYSTYLYGNQDAEEQSKTVMVLVLIVLMLPQLGFVHPIAAKNAPLGLPGEMNLLSSVCLRYERGRSSDEHISIIVFISMALNASIFTIFSSLTAPSIHRKKEVSQSKLNRVLNLLTM